MKPSLVPGDVVRREDTGELVCVRGLEQGKRCWLVRVFWWTSAGVSIEELLSPDDLTLVREARHE